MIIIELKKNNNNQNNSNKQGRGNQVIFNRASPGYVPQIVTGVPSDICLLQETDSC